MPELPEVETVRRRLEPSLAGGVVRSVRLGLPRLLESGAVERLDDLVGLRCQGVERRGKYLLLRFADPVPPGPGRDRILVVHLGMSGQLTWHPAGQAAIDRFTRMPSGLQVPLGPHTPDRHTHLVVDWENGGKLLFRDPRTFGRLLLASPEDLASLPRLARLGPDALDLDTDTFLARWRDMAGRRSVKAVLLDQSFVAGIGNIYADESCFEAGIRPAARAGALSGPRRAALAAAVRAVLRRGLDNCGTTFRDFRHPDGSEGGNQEDLRVYARGGQPCLSCGSTLKSAVVATRGTVWCPRCQR